MAVDPVDFKRGGVQYFQRYTYADNNPYKYTDPTGESFSIIELGFKLALAGLAIEKAAEEIAESDEVSDLELTAKERDKALAKADLKSFEQANKDFADQSKETASSIARDILGESAKTTAKIVSKDSKRKSAIGAIDRAEDAVDGKDNNQAEKSGSSARNSEKEDRN